MHNIFSRIWTEHRYEELHTKSGKPLSEDPLRKWANAAMMMIAAISVLMFFYEEFTVDHAEWLSMANIIVDFIFLADYLLRIIFSGLILVPHTAGEKIRWQFSVARENYMLRWYGMVDVVAVAPPLLYHTVHIGMALGEFSRVARLLRLLRLARLLRIVKALRFLRETVAAQRRLLAHHKKIGMEVKVSFVLIAVVVLGSAVMLHMLDEQNPDLENLGNSIYFSLLSLTGQGNPSELQSFGERFVGIVIISCGLAMLGIITGSFTTYMMERVRMHTSGNRPYHGRGQILICGYSHILPELLGSLAHDNEPRDVVLLFDREREHEAFIEENDYPCMKLGRPLSLHWLRGRGSDVEALRRAQAHLASHILVLTNDRPENESSVELLNAQSLLTLVQLRWLIRNSKDAHQHTTVTAIPVTIEFAGKTFDHGLAIGPEFLLDLISIDAKTCDALDRAIPTYATDVIICGNNRNARLLADALTKRIPPCLVRLHTGVIGDTPQALSHGASQASCVVILAEEGLASESETDAQTLQTFTAMQSMVRRDGVIIAQVYQDAVGEWIESNGEHAPQCIAVRTDLSVARALLMNVTKGSSN